MKPARALAILLVSSTLGLGHHPAGVLSAPPIQVLVNGEPVAFDVPPIEVGGRLLVPLRGVFERLGATVQWDPGTQRITARTSSKTIELVVGQRDGAVDGKPVVLDVPPMVVQGRTMVPLRFVSEALGAYVQWQAATRTVLITALLAEPAPSGYRPTPPPIFQATPVPTPPPIVTPQPTVTPSTRVTEGVLVAINAVASPPRIQVSVGPVIYVFLITRDTAILRFDAATGSGGSVALGALRVGDQTRVEAGPAGNEALSVRATYRLVRGRLDVMTTANIALQDGQVIRINGDATVMVNGASVTLADAPSRARRGDDVTLRLNPVSNEAWELTVISAGTATATPAAAPTRTPSTGTITHGASSDAPLVESAPIIPHPHDVLLVGRDGAGRYRSLAAFNVSLPPGAMVRRATLRLFMYWFHSGGTGIFTVYPVTRPWNEATATWAAMATGYALTRGTTPVTIDAAATRIYVEWDVTDIVRSWVDGSLPNYGFLIRSLEFGPSLLHFGNREDVPGNRPRLIVEYSRP